jgi:hypothetical protein
MITLGNKYSDSITGFSGIATAKTFYLYGCVRVCLEPIELEKGLPKDSYWFDEQRLVPNSEATSGGPGDVAPSRDPSRR